MNQNKQEAVPTSPFGSRRERSLAQNGHQDAAMSTGCLQERSERIKKAQEAIETLLLYRDSEHRHQAYKIAVREVRWLIGVARTFDGQDREWATRKLLWLTSWQAMPLINEVEKALNEIFGEAMPTRLAGWLAALVKKQKDYIRSKSGVHRPGKTARDRAAD
ncbi:MAG: hypothetical protein A2675_02015 [Candidatus Yonathbacteria bacterium RIFCSPHIGHO2_01_FULL_51_10]|uniref:Uncharacterized protein n=1 Tax=Candidatus Yonathbacteria bacterium RIFCSPHIGHO2_01_FULL_51_10 TaxID=1802723 RepID=A0A1G2SB42_9BACT|nr:MAG: hypothetical protein A2675_02015 [Candidatus Yonathbacteria bacterium RIFCSPHIGHO2_01_FULL_51_10]